MGSLFRPGRKKEIIPGLPGNLRYRASRENRLEMSTAGRGNRTVVELYFACQQLMARRNVTDGYFLHL